MEEKEPKSDPVPSMESIRELLAARGFTLGEVLRAIAEVDRERDAKTQQLQKVIDDD